MTTANKLLSFVNKYQCCWSCWEANVHLVCHRVSAVCGPREGKVEINALHQRVHTAYTSPWEESTYAPGKHRSSSPGSPLGADPLPWTHATGGPEQVLTSSHLQMCNFLLTAKLGPADTPPVPSSSLPWQNHPQTIQRDLVLQSCGRETLDYFPGGSSGMQENG